MLNAALINHHQWETEINAKVLSVFSLARSCRFLGGLLKR
jgi:hypothetical protein